MQLEVVEVVSVVDKPATQPNRSDMKSMKLKVKPAAAGGFDQLDPPVAEPIKNGTVALIVEWYAKATSPTPNPGDKLDGDLTHDEKFGWKFKKAGQGGGGGGGGGGRPRDPKDDQRIVRQHAQKCAVELLKTAHELGLLAPASEGETPLKRAGELVTMVKTVAEHLEAHVYRGMDTPIKIDGFDVVPRA
jgi:hypothetical protein